jgi:hypothetical protein
MAAATASKPKLPTAELRETRPAEILLPLFLLWSPLCIGLAALVGGLAMRSGSSDPAALVVLSPALARPSVNTGAARGWRCSTAGRR